MNSELDRIFDKGLSEVTRAPKVPLSDEQIAAAAKESRSGAGVWLLMHAKVILLCAVSLAVGVGITLLGMHLIGNRETSPTPTETAATTTTDTVYTTNTAMVEENIATFAGEPTVDDVETLRATSLQTDKPVTTSEKPNTATAATAVETRHGTSLQTDPNTASAKPNTATTATAVETHGRASLQNDHHTPSVTEPVVIKKTVVQRDTVVINETVTIKDTVYLMDD